MRSSGRGKNAEAILPAQFGRCSRWQERWQRLGYSGGGLFTKTEFLTSTQVGYGQLVDQISQRLHNEDLKLLAL